MSRRIVITLMCAAACFADSAFADEEAAEEKTETAAESPAGGEGAADGLPAVEKPKEEKTYYTLPLCRALEGSAEVRLPLAQQWVPLEEGKFYPLGASYRTLTADSRIMISFGKEVSVSIRGVAAFGTVMQPLGVPDRKVVLMDGEITVLTPRNLPAGMFSVTAPGFTALDAAGESTFKYSTVNGDGDLAAIRCVTGKLAVRGRHFFVPKMDPGDGLDIRTSQDLLLSALYGKRGDFVVQLDHGVMFERDFETNETKSVPRTLEWKMSPGTAVRVHRAVPKVGERLSVTVMAFDANGVIRSRCAYSEGRPEVNTGEQILKKEKDGDKDKKAKEAAEATTTEEAAAEEESGEGGEKKESKEAESSAE